MPRSAALLCSATVGCLAVAFLVSAPDAIGATGPVDTATYVPGPVDVGWQVYVGAAVATIPFIIGAYEFGKRILIQRRCANHACLSVLRT